MVVVPLSDIFSKVLNTPALAITLVSAKYATTPNTDPVRFWHLVQLQAMTNFASFFTVIVSCSQEQLAVLSMVNPFMKT
jgi:hypothetical protein